MVVWAERWGSFLERNRRGTLTEKWVFVEVVFKVWSLSAQLTERKKEREKGRKGRRERKGKVSKKDYFRLDQRFRSLYALFPDAGTLFAATCFK